ncbi:TetR/AcrR family transcriptional regulator [Curtobacterium sp. VKM Ac-1376]|uniref:TetR/AcrR family transcriptional regulator n=1 Tax=Curtobacterium sp. VKM Ac-1376 TaxID=123312 RepID=UPI00188B09A0|nr:TetR family transcriptional regulator [Curtobacterium sp. VKM Ac-1376]MBF4616032.1 TetR family transcriptional regulator [Curtobacterium sp. VKM Ac-1376]
MNQLRDDRQLAAAERCIDAILAAGSTALSVEQLRTAAGISKRTFHRYFPYKARAIRPHYAAMTATFSDLTIAEELRSRDAWVHAWEQVVLGEDPARSLELFRLIRADPEYWSVFLEVVQDGEAVFAEALGGRGGDAAEGNTAIDAEVTAVALVAASRLALTAAVDEGADPTIAFARYLDHFDPPLLATDER